MGTKIGYIGLQHSHCERYVESLQRLPVEITCACEPDGGFDTDSVAALDVDRLPLYRDPSELLETEPIDVAWVTLSNRETRGVIDAAVERDVDVFAEKSLARTADDLEPVVKRARRAGVTVATAYIKRAAPIYRELRDRRTDGFFGDLRAFETRVIGNTLRSRLRAPDQPEYLYTQRDARGGILQWLGCHYLDLVEWVLDDPIETVNASVSRGVEEADTEDSGLVHLETRSGAHGSLHAGYYFPTAPDERGDSAVGPPTPPLQVYGMDGTAVVDPDERTLQLGGSVPAWRSAPVRTLSFEEPSVGGYGGQAGLDYFSAFLDLCDGGDDGGLVATIDDEARVLRMLDAIYESARTDEAVAV